MTSLHPQNGRVADAGLRLGDYLNYRRFPPVYVTEHGAVKHDSAACQHVRGRTHYAICREDALYVYGERWCSGCWPSYGGDRS